MSYVVIAGRVLLGAVFLLAAVSKLAGPAAFRAFAASATALLPWSPASTRTGSRVAGGVLAAELAVPVLLLAGPTAPIGLGVAVLLFAGFAAVLTRAVRAGTRQECRCFGPSADVVGWRHVTRNVVLAVVALVVAAGGPAAGVHPAGVLVAIAAGALLAGLAAYADEMAELFTTPAR
jgi:hypothetical protein